MTHGCAAAVPQRPIPDPTTQPRPTPGQAGGGRAIVVGDNVWLGGGVIVCPGVGSGRTPWSVPARWIRDLPAKAVALSNPAHVIRLL